MSKTNGGFSGRFTVHSCARTKVEVTALLGERPTPVTVEGLVVELAPDEAPGKSVTLCWVPEDIAAAEAVFQPGATIAANFLKV